MCEKYFIADWKPESPPVCHLDNLHQPYKDHLKSKKSKDSIILEADCFHE